MTTSVRDFFASFREDRPHGAGRGLPAFGLAAIFVAIGIGIRLYRLDEQFLLDDEFHSIMAAAHYPFRYLATHFLFAANSIPFNLYTRVLYDLYGWDEMSLRVPSIIAGIGLVISAWRFARDYRPPAEQLLIVGLLAISPILVYYSRITRPYGVLVWLVFLNTAASYRLVFATNTPAPRIRVWTPVVWGLTAAAAVWVHQVAAFTVAANALVLAGSWLRDRLHHNSRAKAHEVLIAAGTLAVAGAVVLGPPLVLSGSAFAKTYQSRDLYNLQTLWGYFQLIFGTGWTLPTLTCAAVTARGIAVAWHSDRVWFTLITVQTLSNFAALALIRAPDLYAPIVLVRYTAALIPVLLITQATGWANLTAILARRPSRHWESNGPVAMALVASAICGVEFAWGPLPSTFMLGGNFMHHAAYQESFHFDRTRAFSNVHRPPLNVTSDSLPDFYKHLPPTKSTAENGVIEYPFLLGHNYCQAYFAQLHHGRPVWGAYVGDPSLVDPPSAHLRGCASIGTVARAMTDPAAFHFRRFVDLRDTNAIKATRARFLVVHLRPACEISGSKDCQEGVDYSESDTAYLFQLAATLEQTLGAPIYTDQWIRVFDLQAMPHALELPTDNATSLRHQAKLLETPEMKLQLLARAASLSPSDPLVQLDTAFVLLDQGEFHKALPVLETVLTLSATDKTNIRATVLERSAFASFRLGDLEEAERYLQRALQLYPGDAGLRERLQSVRHAAQ